MEGWDWVEVEGWDRVEVAFDGSYLEVTPLVRPSTRLTLSNVYPEIPNQIVLENLFPFCKVVSQIRPIPLGIKSQSMSHIMSFRRQVYVIVAQNVTPPASISFQHASVTHRIFLSTDAIRCFKCGGLGHMSRSCKWGTPTPTPTHNLTTHSILHPPSSIPNANPIPNTHPKTLTRQFVVCFVFCCVVSVLNVPLQNWLQH